MLNRTGKNGHSCLIPGLRKKAISPLRMMLMMLTVGFFDKSPLSD